MKTAKDGRKYYKSQPSQSHFWIYDESCYTDNALNFRKKVLEARSHSGMDESYLSNPSSWFAEDSQAFINVYENSWFFSPAYRTRHVLSRSDFYVQAPDSQHLQRPSFYKLMQEVGDYLLIRNELLRAKHLSNPMNFILLDINAILKKLSQNSDIQKVNKQLGFLVQYVRAIETEISPPQGSDKLFLVNFRTTIEHKIRPELTQILESQLLRDKLGEILQISKKLSIDRNRILHYALSAKPVNPHSYDFFMESEGPGALFPTQAAKKCGLPTTAVVAGSESVPIIRLSKDQLKSCPDFKLITTDDDILDHYAKAISDLNELDRFQKIILEIRELLGQAGEVYTIYQFNQQMLFLLKQMDAFIDESSLHIEAILDSNTYFYHKTIEEELSLSVWSRLFSYGQTNLQAFIKNQDTLAQFSSSTSNMQLTNHDLKFHITQIIAHLSQTKLHKLSFDTINGHAQKLDSLITSMRVWIHSQAEFKELEENSTYEQSSSPPRMLPEELEPIEPESPKLMVYPSLFSPRSTSSLDYKFNSSGLLTGSTHSSEIPIIYLSLFIIIPVSILILLLYLFKNNSNSQQLFNDLKKQFKEELSKLKNKENTDELIQPSYLDFVEEFNILCENAKAGTYDVHHLTTLYEELVEFNKNGSNMRLK